jgi:hypothetical protein
LGGLTPSLLFAYNHSHGFFSGGKNNLSGLNTSFSTKPSIYRMRVKPSFPSYI